MAKVLMSQYNALSIIRELKKKIHADKCQVGLVFCIRHKMYQVLSDADQCVS